MIDGKTKDNMVETKKEMNRRNNSERPIIKKKTQKYLSKRQKVLNLKKERNPTIFLSLPLESFRFDIKIQQKQHKLIFSSKKRLI